MGAFACVSEKEGENCEGKFCFYDWMYAAFWFSNDTVENKCTELIQTWCIANKVNGLLTKENVSDMLECFWKVWTRVSCHLG
jgi:hypothetical protein